MYFAVDFDDVLAAGSRPDWLLLVSGPQERVPRYTVEQIVYSAPDVRSCAADGAGLTEQEIEVPMISGTACPLRAVLAATQVPEQLVEGPIVFPTV